MIRALFFSVFLLFFTPFDAFAQKEKNILIDEIRKVEGYRIQIYKGINKQEAIESKKKAYQIRQDYTVYTEYSKPNYRIRVGDFTDKTECEKVWAEFIKTFPQAEIVKAMVTIVNKD
jgi:hypothetical protein